MPHKLRKKLDLRLFHTTLTDSKIASVVIFLAFFIFLASTANQASAQTYRSNNPRFSQNQQAFRQEIARLDIRVYRKGEKTLPMALVPRVQASDLIRIRMIDEPINGIRPKDSFWDWTLTVAFVNPSRNEVEEESVSREINFRKDGWYREHTIKVPYDSQPIFFLYPKPKYRKKIKKLIRKNFSQIREIGEKTLEIAGAYAQIGMFLNELQATIDQSTSGFNRTSYGGRNQIRFREDFLRDEFVERLAQSFNITLPNCWRNGNRTYNSQDFVGRAQCIAKNVRLEDFDLSVSRMLQQGGLLAATKLVEKYPQLAYWINVAAAAADLIINILKKTPLRIVPTMASASPNSIPGYQNNSRRPLNRVGIRQKISLFATKPPGDNDFVTAFPIVLHKWQANPDPDVIELPVPIPLDPCLHLGQNLLKNTDLSYDWLRDPFARDFRLVMTAKNGFSRTFRLSKNLGASGWMLNLTPQDIQAFPKVRMELRSKIVATRGFNQLESKEFSMPIPLGGKWEVSKPSLKGFSVGDKRKVVIKNSSGSSRCLQTAKFKLSSGGEFRFDSESSSNSIKFSEDGKEAWFEIDTSSFQAGQGTLELNTFGTRQPQRIQLKLYPKPPNISKIGAHKGDNKIWLEGERISQIKAISVSGKTAQPDNSSQRNRSTEDKNRSFVFTNPSDLILSKQISITVKLEGDRDYEYPEKFPVLPARPAISANSKNEIDAVATKTNQEQDSSLDLSKLPVFSVSTESLSASIKTKLSDYAFKTENLSIETRIENGRVGQNALPKAEFEVLDSLNLKINFALKPNYRRFLSGRRLQFRIKDKVRGSSDWYTIKNTFVRAPLISSVDCGNNICIIIGTGLDYIGQISTDDGKTYKPAERVQAALNGKFSLQIQGVENRQALRIKLRDFPKMDGVSIK